MELIFQQLTGQIMPDMTNMLLVAVAGIITLALIVFGFSLLMNVIDPPMTAAHYQDQLEMDRSFAHKYRGTAKGDLYRRKYQRGLRTYEENYGDKYL